MFGTVVALLKKDLTNLNISVFVLQGDNTQRSHVPVAEHIRPREVLWS